MNYKKNVLHIGQRFGKLTVIEEEIKYKVKCKCDCGKEIYARKYELLKGTKKECKDCAKERKHKEKICVEVGQRMGNYTIVEIIDSTKIKVQCDCGNESIVTQNQFFKKLSHQKYCSNANCKCRKEALAKSKQERAKEEIGKRYGNLTVLGEVSLEKQLKSKRTLVRCQCDCGNIVETQVMMLRGGLKKSCGCLYKKSNGINHKKAVKVFEERARQSIGKKFGHLTVLGFSSKKENGFWVNVKCDCGTITEKRLASLKKGDIKYCSVSCECKKKK